MIANNETVKGRGEAPSPLFTKLPRRGLLGNRQLPVCNVLGKLVLLKQWMRSLIFTPLSCNNHIYRWGRSGFDVSGQRPVRHVEFAGDSLNAGT
jgi:hypothetical protein